MKYAFIIMDDFDVQKDSAGIHDNHARIVGVSNLEEACMAAKRLYEDGVDCIELCGAFGPAGAKKIIDVTENQIPVGYITHLPEQDPLYQKVFGTEN